jgi:hypothetical protein
VRLTKSRDVDQSLRSLTRGKSDERLLLEVLGQVVDDQTEVLGVLAFTMLVSY